MKAGHEVRAQARWVCSFFALAAASASPGASTSRAWAQPAPAPASSGAATPPATAATPPVSGAASSENASEADGDPEAEIMEEEAAREAELERIHEGFHMGPALSFGLPHWKFSLDGRYGPAGFAVSYGYTPRRLGSTKLTITNIEATFRAIPFRNPFYVGLSFGQQNLRAEKKRSGRESALEKIRSEYLTPHAGLQYNVVGDFFLAHELGFVLFTSSTRDKGLSSGAGSPTDATSGTDPQDVADVRDVAARHAKYWMPHVTLLRAGYLF